MAGYQTGELELLAPARNTDIGIAAIDCGADAVYMAGPRFGARQAAGNSMEDLERLCRYAHRFGARIFVTLNTILYDSELDDAYSQLVAAQDAGADAVIVQDMAMVEMVRRSEGRITLPLHASTQCAIRTPEQARFYEDLGFSRLILERELSLEQIRAIREAVGCELEFFVHGALCVCYSGQCYMSEAITGRSANRGACAQACRALYDLEDGTGRTLVKNKALLSLKDFNLKDRLGDLAEAGITSFKIEGRLKNISYVRNVVRSYSMAMDRMIQDRRMDRMGTCARRTSYGTVSGGFTPDLDKTFNRGYTSLFIDGKRGKWSTYDSAKGMGEEIGTVSSVNPEKTSFRITPGKKWSADSRGNDAGGKAPLELHNGDGLSFVARNSEVVGFRADVCHGLEVRCKPVAGLYQGARLFRNVDAAFEKEVENDTPLREIGVTLEICIHENGGIFTMTASATSEDGRKAVKDFPAGDRQAANRGRMESIFAGQLSKSSGHYRFRPVLHLEDAHAIPFMSAASLNSIRREMASELDKAPCIARPLMNRTMLLHSQGKHGAMPVHDVTYKSNVSNRLAEKTYGALGAHSIEKAFEIEHKRDAELMRMKYCIRYELGMCPKEKAVSKGSQDREGPSVPGVSGGRLFLANNGRRFPLLFDCGACEMAVLSDKR